VSAGILTGEQLIIFIRKKINITDDNTQKCIQKLSFAKLPVDFNAAHPRQGSSAGETKLQKPAPLPKNMGSFRTLQQQ
jgi:hypothetical protein